MLFNCFFISISIIWLLSEITLARLKSSARSVNAENKDQGSIRLLWLVIVISVICGVYAGLSGIGLIGRFSGIISRTGVALILIGLIIRWIAILSLRKFFTVDVAVHKNHQLKKSGIYRHVRHPAYLGSLISFLGLGLAFSNWVSILIIFLPILLVFLLRIRIEEKALRETLGSEYLEYAARTKKLLPRIY